MSDNKLFKEILKLQENKNKPDLHSFTARTRDAKVYVEARAGEIYIREFRNNSDTVEWSGTAIAATNRLEKLGIDLDSIEI